MRFTRTDEQVDFARTLDRLLAGADTVSAARAWADADTEPGLALWRSLAENGLHALVVPEDADGMGATAVELSIAFEALGRHAVPGPYVESAAFLPAVMSGDALAGLAAGTVATVAAPPHTPYALDAETAEVAYLVQDSTLYAAQVGEAVTSLDPTRRLAYVQAGAAQGELPDSDLRRAFDQAALATAAQLLGLGEHVLETSVDYVKQRRQFGREIGSYQAIKHKLADVRIALDFVRPLVDGAAVGFHNDEDNDRDRDRDSDGDSDRADARSRDVSAAKVAASDAARLAARTGLQVHGAIGYTAELDLSLWLLKTRALIGAWGTPDWHRERLLQCLGRLG